MYEVPWNFSWDGDNDSLLLECFLPVVVLVPLFEGDSAFIFKVWGANILCAPVGSSSGRNSLMYFCSACLSIKKTRQSELSLVRDALNWFLQISGLDTLAV